MQNQKVLKEAIKLLLYSLWSEAKYNKSIYKTIIYKELIESKIIEKTHYNTLLIPNKNGCISLQFRKI